MSAKPTSVPARPAPRLYLATPVVTDPAPLAAALPDLLDGVDVAAVLVRLAPSDDRTLTERAKKLVAPIQRANVACLLDGHPGIVARSGADGAHLDGIAAMTEALEGLRPQRIAGVGGLVTRHDAMLAGEAGADYVLFGEPDADGKRPSVEAICERLQWWEELFEPPCVGFAATLEEASAFVAAGADFVLVGDLVWNDPRGPREALTDAARAIRQDRARSG
ncbi:MAG: thiamine phosphate synthase [Pseudomonadota bacterium]